MRTLITGATGFLGRHLVAQLLQAGETVRCFVRSRAALGNLPPLSVEISEGEVGDQYVSNLSRHPLPLNRKLARQLLAPAWTCSAAKA